MDKLIFECKSSMDKMTRFKTIFVASIFIVTMILIYLSSKNSGNGSAIFVILFLLILYSIVMGYGIQNTPISYRLYNTHLVINKRYHPISILLRDIHMIREFDKADKKGLIRTGGAEGVIGNLGHYSSKLHKKLTVYTSRDTNWVLIQTKQGKKYVISPDDLAIVEKINELIYQKII
jgi:hypothetical protein